MKNVQYIVTVTCGDGQSDVRLVCDADFRIRRMLVGVDSMNQAIIEGIYINNDRNQLAMPIDGYMYSPVLAEQLRTAFLTEHGLLGKSHDEIDAYCDEHELALPSPGNIDLPGLPKNGFIRVVGKFTQITNVCFTGAALL